MMFPIQVFYGMWGKTLNGFKTSAIDGVITQTPFTARFIVQGGDSNQDDSIGADIAGTVKVFYSQEKLEKGDFIIYENEHYRIFSIESQEQGCGYKYTAGLSGVYSHDQDNF